ncbi:MAG: acyl-CoA dehydrogenase family protein [Myxococcota bacterium]
MSEVAPRPTRRPPSFTSLDTLPALFAPHHRSLVAHLAVVAEAMRAEASHDAAEVAAQMGTQRFGLYPYLVPRRHGGADTNADDAVDVRALVLIRDALGYASPLADAIFAVQGLGSYPIVLAGTDAQHERYLPGVVRGDRIAGFGLTEPEAGSDVASMRCEARPDGDGGWILDGDKHFISNVPIAHHHVVFARVVADDDATLERLGAPSDPRRRITAFIVAHDAPGLTQHPQALSIHHPIGALRLRGCRVPGEARVGAIGQGFKLAMQTLDTFRISVGAAANGMATAALEDALGFVRQRTQFGRPLSDQQMVQGYLADMATDLDAARLLVVRAAHQKDVSGARASTEVAMAKMFATEAAQRIIDKAVQLHGGRGVLAETRVENLYRDIRPLRIYEGTTEIQRLIIARGLLRDDR